MTNVPKERTVEEIKSFSELLDSVQVGDTVTGFLRADLLETHHQELQKARESERKRIWNEAQKLRIEADDCSDESFTEGEFYLHMGGLDSILNPKD